MSHALKTCENLSSSFSLGWGDVEGLAACQGQGV